MILSLLVMAFGPVDCNGTYGGVLRAQSPDHFTEQSGQLTDFYDDGNFTHFTFNDRDYTVQHPNVTAAQFDNATCRFVIIYNAEPILRGDFE